MAFLLQVLGHARRFAQLDHHRLLGNETSKAMPVGTQRIAQHMRVAPVILGTGDGETVAEAIELLRVDHVDRETAFEQRLDNRAVRHLDRHGHRHWLGAGNGQQPDAQLGETDTAMRKSSFTSDLASGIDKADLMYFAHPVDADGPSRLLRHRAPPLLSAKPPQRSPFPVLALSARLPTGFASRPTLRGTCPSQALEAQGAIGGSRKVGQVRPS
jgi:hypothetical protein